MNPSGRYKITKICALITEHKILEAKTDRNKESNTIDNWTLIVGNFSTYPQQWIEQLGRSKRKLILENTIKQLDLTGIYRTFYSTTGEHTFFSNIHRILSKVGHILGHKKFSINLKGLNEI